MAKWPDCKVFPNNLLREQLRLCAESSFLYLDEIMDDANFIPAFSYLEYMYMHNDAPASGRGKVVYIWC